MHFNHDEKSQNVSHRDAAKQNNSYVDISNGNVLQMGTETELGFNSKSDLIDD